ncbi:hypothetical protein SAMN05444487_105118 [Marininema mesophilum]|uniref:Uncharacterized protein n=1 Tax=Marininema mesophilum TaxID=1048340 RepID=A0A1H2VIC2_9BACL|nr:hypothetical protein [Marininema mesophilum]SDW68082.1 hypothetical protein SAMN05444487_105118 [Marininema mesophilum]
MSVETHIKPSLLEEFRSMKLNSMIRDLNKLNTDELIRIQREVDHLLDSTKE